MSYETIEQLQQQHSAAKRRMILGIVFVAIAVVLSVIGSVLTEAANYDTDSPLFTIAVVIIFVMIALYAVGIPFLISGIIRLVKSNTRLNAAKAEMAQGGAYYPQPQYPDPQYQQPLYQQPLYQEPQYQEPQYQDPYGDQGEQPFDATVSAGEIRDYPDSTDN